jgi:hypothetical protein
MGDVIGRSGDEVVHADDLVAVAKEPVTEVRAEESGGTRDEHTHGWVG